MKKFIFETTDRSGQMHSGSFVAKTFAKGLEMLNEMGAKNIKSHDPVSCKDPIRSWEFVKDGLLWFVSAGPGHKK